MNFRPIQHCIDATKKLPIDDLVLHCVMSDRIVVVCTDKLRELGVNVEKLIHAEGEVPLNILIASNAAGKLLEKLTNQETIGRN